MAGFRLAVGLLAACFMVTAELLGGVVMYEKGWMKWIWETDGIAALAGVGVLVLFALMPRLLMVLEQEQDEMGNKLRTSHGHKEKLVTAAL